MHNLQVYKTNLQTIQDFNENIASLQSDINLLLKEKSELEGNQSKLLEGTLVSIPDVEPQPDFTKAILHFLSPSFIESTLKSLEKDAAALEKENGVLAKQLHHIQNPKAASPLKVNIPSEGTPTALKKAEKVLEGLETDLAKEIAKASTLEKTLTSLQTLPATVTVETPTQETETQAIVEPINPDADLYRYNPLDPNQNPEEIAAKLKKIDEIKLKKIDEILAIATELTDFDREVNTKNEVTIEIPEPEKSIATAIEELPQNSVLVEEKPAEITPKEEDEEEPKSTVKKGRNAQELKAAVTALLKNHPNGLHVDSIRDTLEESEQVLFIFFIKNKEVFRKVEHKVYALI
jgi:hypothetical protein